MMIVSKDRWQASDPAPDLPQEMQRTGSSRPAWAAALLAVGILLAVIWVGWEGRAGSPERADLVSPPAVAAPEPAWAPGRKPERKAQDEGRCYCLAIPGPLEPRFEARLVSDGRLLTAVPLAEGTADRLTGRVFLADGRATAAVLDLAWNDHLEGGESEVLASLQLGQRYDRYVPGHFLGQFSSAASERPGTDWRYVVRWNTSDGGALLLIEIEPAAAPSVQAGREGLPAVVVGRKLGAGQLKQ
jgi:hypothetical protein